MENRGNIGGRAAPMTRVACLLLAISCLTGFVCGQQIKDSSGTSAENLEPTRCEQNIGLLEAANAGADTGTFLMIVSRPGIRERDNITGRARLFNAVTYLTKYTSLRNSSTIVVTEGERQKTSRNGTLEVFVKGKLFGRLVVKENLSLPVGSCEPQEIESEDQIRKRQMFFPKVGSRHVLAQW